jgi:hypothetical protein
MLQLQSERYTHPLTGARCQRKLLGACASGKLFVLPHTKTKATDLLWTGADITSALDWLMRQTMQREPTPVNIPNTYWLVRLPSPPSSYLIEPLEGGGAELFELSPCWIRRPGGNRW